jgi:hypothetical protein
MVDVILVAAIVPLIAKILTEAAGKALRIGEIESKVKDVEIKIRVNDQEKLARADTFNIRDAVNELLSAGQVEFEQPGYKVKLKDPGEGMTEPPSPATPTLQPTSGKSKP